MSRLSLIFGFVNKFQNANLKEIRNYLIKQKINSLFDYWEIDKERLFIEME